MRAGVLLLLAAAAAAALAIAASSAAAAATTVGVAAAVVHKRKAGTQAGRATPKKKRKCTPRVRKERPPPFDLDRFEALLIHLNVVASAGEVAVADATPRWLTPVDATAVSSTSAAVADSASTSVVAVGSLCL